MSRSSAHTLIGPMLHFLIMCKFHVISYALRHMNNRQQNIEFGQQVCTASVSKQHFLELLSSLLVECPIFTPKFPGSNPETGEAGKRKEIL